MPVVRVTQDSIHEAATLLKGGGVVAFPTETVYGLGCDTFNTQAIQQVYTMKGRPTNNPLIAHVADQVWAKKVSQGWDTHCDRLAEKFWPGPLTIVLPKNKIIPDEATGGHETIAVRCPRHVAAVSLLQDFGHPISAPSANKSGRTSPTSAQHVEDDFGRELFVLDGGSCDQGIESTVLSMVDEPTVLRLGSIGLDAISRVVGDVALSTSSTQTDSPGSTRKHYATNTTLILLSSEEIERGLPRNTVCLTIIANPPNAWRVIEMPSEAPLYAKRLYAAMREADTLGADTICLEQPPAGAEWEAVHDRIRRAASS